MTNLDNCSVLGVLYDMGETNALKETFDALDEANIDYRVLVLGAASINAPKSGYRPDRLLFLDKDIKLDRTCDPRSWKREEAFSKEEMIKITNFVKKLNPELIISGSVSEVQRQITLESPSEHKLVYYDNLRCRFKDNPAKEVVESFIRPEFKLLVPSKSIKDSIIATKGNKAEVETVGHPALESFSREVKSVEAKRIRRELELDDNKTTLCFIGGYGESYNQDFAKFLSFLKNLEAEYPFELLIQLHPKSNSHKTKEVPEYRILKESKLSSKVMFSHGVLSTAMSVAISDLCLSVGSTVIPQAALSGKPTAFLFQSANKDLMLESEVSTNIESQEDLKLMLESSSNNKTPSFQKEAIFLRAGIPQNATENIKQSILRRIDSYRKANAKKQDEGLKNALC